MAHDNQLTLRVLMTSLGVKGHTESWETHEHDQQFADIGNIDIWKCQRLRKEGNARMHKVSAMRSDVAKRIKKVCISTYFESLETDLYLAEDAGCIDYADTWSLKQDH
jgi:hypothetical protein